MRKVFASLGFVKVEEMTTDEKRRASDVELVIKSDGELKVFNIKKPKDIVNLEDFLLEDTNKFILSSNIQASELVTLLNTKELDKSIKNQFISLDSIMAYMDTIPEKISNQVDEENNKLISHTITIKNSKNKTLDIVIPGEDCQIVVVGKDTVRIELLAKGMIIFIEKVFNFIEENK